MMNGNFGLRAADRFAIGLFARLASVLPALVAALLSAGAHAETPAVEWICWHDNAKSLLCQLSSSEDGYVGGAMADAKADVTDAAPRRGVLPRLAHAILQDPASLKGRRITIPMFSEPEDWEFMVELAESVMCGTKIACSVHFVRQVPELALLLDEHGDPALN